LAAAVFLAFLSIPAAAGSFTVPLPGTLLRAVAVHGPGGRPGVALLVAASRDGTGERALLFLEPSRRGVERLAGGLHPEINSLAAFDLDGDGGAEPIAGMPGVLFAPSAEGRARKVLEEPDVDLRSVRGPTEGRPWLPVARAGLLELLARGPGGGLVRGASFSLPQRAERLRWGLRLSSPPVTLLPGDPPLFAAGPEAAGRRRLKTLLIRPGGETVEAWSLLPGEERLSDDRVYLRIDGAPALAVATFGKLGLLAKKRLRLFPLGRDRSRQGSAPALAVETECPLWHPLAIVARDVDGDGRRDLVLTHPGGLRGNELLVSVHRGLGGARFEPKPRRWKLDAEPTDWIHGPDLTGDGAPDLLVLAGGRLLLFAGDAKGSRPLAGRPYLSIAVAGAPKKERGDGEVEDEAPAGEERERVLEALELAGGGWVVLARGTQQDGRTVLTVVRDFTSRSWRP
jgi:hypothetical protein